MAFYKHAALPRITGPREIRGGGREGYGSNGDDGGVGGKWAGVHLRVPPAMTPLRPLLQGSSETCYLLPETMSCGFHACSAS